MNMFSKACEYDIRAAIYIAMSSLNDDRVSLRDIAYKIASPEAFTAKILQQLVHHQIIRSVKGAYGGFEIDKKQMKHITLSHIVIAIDGDTLFHGCALGLPECSDRYPCPVHHHFKRIRTELKTMLETTTLHQLAIGLETGMAFLKR
jgi:Rrf2 family protein